MFKDMNNFEIDARGVTILLPDPTRGAVQFERCRNVTFRGATLVYEISPSTQGTVEAVAADGMSYDIRIDKGYPTNLDDASYFKESPIGYLFDPKTRWWKTGAGDLYAKGNPQRLGPDLFRVFWKKNQGPSANVVAVGDLIAFRGAGHTTVALMNTSNMHLTDITLYSGPGMAFREQEGDGDNHYDHLVVKRGPRIGAATTDPLLSSTADAFHSLNMRKGPTVENSYFEAMTDDGIAIHGHFNFVFEGKDNTLVLNHSIYRVGDLLKLYDPVGRPAGEATVTALKDMPGFHNTQTSKRVTRKDTLGGPYTEVTLDHPLPAAFDYLAQDASASSGGFTIRNNSIVNHRARGMVIKATDGLIEHNTIDGSTMSAMLIAPEFWWNEAGYTRNLIVRDNTIRHVGYAQKASGGIQLVALSGEDEDQKKNAHPITGYGHQNVTFEGNHFEDINGTNLLVSSAKDVMIRNNTFLRPEMEAVESNNEKWGEDSGAVIFIAAATNVTLQGNTVKSPGKANNALVKAMPDSQVKGLTDGVKLVK